MQVPPPTPARELPPGLVNDVQGIAEGPIESGASDVVQVPDRLLIEKILRDGDQIVAGDYTLIRQTQFRADLGRRPSETPSLTLETSVADERLWGGRPPMSTVGQRRRDGQIGGSWPGRAHGPAREAGRVVLRLAFGLV
jgi:hypothetical protein